MSYITPTFIVAYFGDQITIPITLQGGEESNWRLYLQTDIASDTGITITTTRSSSVKWTPPSSLYLNLPDNAELSLNLILSYTNAKGEKERSSTVLTLRPHPTRDRPVISSYTLTDTTGAKDALGVYIVGKSQIKLTPAVTTKNGAKWPECLYVDALSIGGYVDWGGQYTTRLGVQNQSSVTIGVPLVAGNSTLSFYVTDSRNQKSANTTTTIQAVNYTAPQVTTFTVQRCDADGTLNDSGVCVKLSYSFAIDPVNNQNAKGFAVQYNNGQGNWITVENVTDVYTKTAEKIIAGPFSTDQAYQFQYKITDAFGTITNTSQKILPSKRIINIWKTMRSVGIGRMAEGLETFRIAFETWFEKKVHFAEIEADSIKITGSNLFLETHPVGSLYLSTSGTDPGTIYGGRWNAFGAGRTLVGVGTGNDGETQYTVTPDSRGGEYFHELTWDEMPEHGHNLSSDGTAHSFSWGGSGKTVYAPVSATAGNGDNNYINTKQNDWSATQPAGLGYAHNNMQPYIAVYMWIRVA